jgi:hypothetical protein
MTEPLLARGGANARIGGGVTQARRNAGTQAPTADSLSEEEISQLLFVREEEKLARDVYITLGGIWDEPVFAAIAASEQRHMDAVGRLIEKYGLVDPVTDDTVGVFSDPNLKTLYDQLTGGAKADAELSASDAGIEDGTTSLVAALRVGAFIEEYDILDLQDALEGTSAKDIENVYENLLQGSGNHLRSFVAQIEANGETYEPVLMNSGAAGSLYTEIIAGDRDSGNGNGGSGQGRGGWNR